MVKKEQVDLNHLATPPDLASKKKSAQAFVEARRASAWSVHRWPMDRYFAEKRTRLHLPTSYLARSGLTTKTVYPGEDINQAVWKFYAESSQGGDSKVNYVHADLVDERRHEYLGPDPRIAGYHIDARGEFHIRWWDGFLRDQWMEEGKWNVEVEWDGAKWAEK